MFKIGDFSKLCQVPVSALRYYADIGLLEPAHIDSESGYRYYLLDQLPRLNRILALKDLGLSLTAVSHILNDSLTVVELQGMLRLKEAELEQTLADTQIRLNRVKTRIHQIERENHPAEIDVVVKNIEAQPVLSIREIIPDKQHVEHLFLETAQAVMGQAVDLVGAPLTIFHDAEFKEASLDIEIAYPISASAASSLPLANGRKLASQTLPAISTVASKLHVGDYAHFPETYTALARWITSSGYHIGGQPREIYLRPPNETEAALTEIQYPIKLGATA